jgi:hypothetical protein
MTYDANFLVIRPRRVRRKERHAALHTGGREEGA